MYSKKVNDKLYKKNCINNLVYNNIFKLEVILKENWKLYINIINNKYVLILSKKIINFYFISSKIWIQWNLNYFYRAYPLKIILYFNAYKYKVMYWKMLTNILTQLH